MHINGRQLYTYSAYYEVRSAYFGLNFKIIFEGPTFKQGRNNKNDFFE